MTHDERLMKLAGLEISQPETEYNQRRGEGWRPTSHYFPGKAARFPMLRQECPCIKGEKEGKGRGFPNICDGINHWFDLGGCKHCYIRGKHRPDCSSCEGRGWVLVDSLEATLEAGLIISEHIGIIRSIEGHIEVQMGGPWSEGTTVKEAAIAALYEAMKAEVKQDVN